MRISDWSSDVCSSDLAALGVPRHRSGLRGRAACPTSCATLQACHGGCATWHTCLAAARIGKHGERGRPWGLHMGLSSVDTRGVYPERFLYRSEEHTSELQSLLRNSYALFTLYITKTILTINTHLT